MIIINIIYRALLKIFAVPEVDLDDMYEYISEKCHVDKDVVVNVINREEEYLRFKGVIKKIESEE